MGALGSESSRVRSSPQTRGSSPLVSAQSECTNVLAPPRLTEDADQVVEPFVGDALKVEEELHRLPDEDRGCLEIDLPGPDRQGLELELERRAVPALRLRFRGLKR